MQKNSPELWDKLFENENSKTKDQDIFSLKKEENSVRWQGIKQTVLKEFGSFQNLSVIEIGAGQCTCAALMAKEGAKITLLDYSKKALDRSRKFLSNNDVKADFIEQNALELPENLMAKFDISMSFGLTEHFVGDERININKAHIDLLKKGGLTFISVPNKFCPPYRIYKFIAEKTGRWGVGEEYPYSRRELGRLCRLFGITDYSFLGDSFYASWHFINPLKIVRKITRSTAKQKIKREKSSIFDRYFSYALVLCAKK